MPQGFLPCIELSLIISSYYQTKKQLKEKLPAMRAVVDVLFVCCPFYSLFVRIML